MKKIEIYLQSRINEFKKKIPNIFDDVFYRDRIVQAIITITTLFLVLVWAAAFLNFKISDYVVPTRYDSFIGVTNLGGWLEPYKLPLFFTLITVTNTILSKVIYKKDKLISYLLFGTNIFLAIMVVIIIFNFGNITEGIK